MNKLVFSTEKDIPKRGRDKKGASNAPVSDGPCKIRLEKKARGGKSVTVLFELPFPKSEAKKLMREIQTLIGTGATYKNDTIELRGDVRDKVEDLFQKKGLKIIRAGG